MRRPRPRSGRSAAVFARLGRFVDGRSFEWASASILFGVVAPVVCFRAAARHALWFDSSWLWFTWALESALLIGWILVSPRSTALCALLTGALNAAAVIGLCFGVVTSLVGSFALLFGVLDGDPAKLYLGALGFVPLTCAFVYAVSAHHANARAREMVHPARGRLLVLLGFLAAPIVPYLPSHWLEHEATLCTRAVRDDERAVAEAALARMGPLSPFADWDPLERQIRLARGAAGAELLDRAYATALWERATGREFLDRDDPGE